MDPPATRSRLQSESGPVLLALLLWVTLGVHLVHPSFHAAGGHRDDLCVAAGHDWPLSPESAAPDCPHVHSAVRDGYAAEPCPICTFVARTGSWTATPVPVLAPASVLGSHPRLPDSRSRPARLLLSQRSRAPPTASSLPA